MNVGFKATIFPKILVPVGVCVMTAGDRPSHSIPALEQYRVNGNPLYQFWMGLRFSWSGLCLFAKSPRLQLLGIVPTVLTGGSFVGLIWFGIRVVRNAIDPWVMSLPHWLGMIAEIVGSSVAAIALLLLSYAVFVPLVGIISAPFRDAMSMHTEQLLRGEATDNGLGLGQSLVQIGLLLGFQLVVVVMIIAANISAPGIGTLLSVAIALYMTTLDMVDPALGLRGYLLRQKLTFVRHHFALLAGFGLLSFALFLVPGLNLAILPVATIGGTLLVMAVTDGEGSPN